MKYILSTALLFSFLTSFSQLQVNVKWAQPRSIETKDTIYYNPAYKLDWDDFKGKPVENHRALAITSSGFGFTAGFSSKNGRSSLNINVYCYFSKNNSWVRTNQGTDYALNHEQHHFDVSYIATCLFFKKLKEAKFTNGNYSEVLERLYKESTDEMERLQNQYDGSTKNGQLKDVQAQWNNKIEAMLAETAAIN